MTKLRGFDDGCAACSRRIDLSATTSCLQLTVKKLGRFVCDVMRWVVHFCKGEPIHSFCILGKKRLLERWLFQESVRYSAAARLHKSSFLATLLEASMEELRISLKYILVVLDATGCGDTGRESIMSQPQLLHDKRLHDPAILSDTISILAKEKLTDSDQDVELAMELVQPQLGITTEKTPARVQGSTAVSFSESPEYVSPERPIAGKFPAKMLVVVKHVSDKSQEYFERHIPDSQVLALAIAVWQKPGQILRGSEVSLAPKIRNCDKRGSYSFDPLQGMCDVVLRRADDQEFEGHEVELQDTVYHQVSNSKVTNPNLAEERKLSLAHWVHKVYHIHDRNSEDAEYVVRKMQEERVWSLEQFMGMSEEHMKRLMLRVGDLDFLIQRRKMFAAKAKTKKAPWF
jgi:hypothetical protein